MEPAQSSGWYGAWRKVCFFSGLTLKDWAFRLVNIAMVCWVDGLSGFQEIQRDYSLLFCLKRQGTSLYPLRGTSWTSSVRNSLVLTPWTPWTAILAPACGDLASHDRQWCDSWSCYLQPTSWIGPDNLQVVVFLFLHEWSRDLPGANFVIFQHCCHCFQHIEASIQLNTQFPCHILPICAGELMETLFFFLL